MTIISSIDPAPPARIYLHSDTVGAEVHPVDIYKEVRALRGSDESLRPYDMFCSMFGNVAKGGGKFTERYLRLNNGCRIVPYDTDHEITITGTLITDDGTEGVAAFDRSALSPSSIVDINYVPPQVEVVTINTGSGLSIEQDEKLTEIHAGAIRHVHLDVNNLGAETGSPTEPFASFSNAIAFANIKGLKLLHMHSSMSLDADLNGFELQGVSDVTLDLGGFDVTDSIIREVRVQGDSTGSASYENCGLVHGLTGMNGFYSNCILLGELTTEAGALILMNLCVSGIAGSLRPAMSLGDANVQLSCRAWSGGIEFRDIVVGNMITIEVLGGEVRFAASCTGGDAHVRGSAFLENLGTIVPVTRALGLTDIDREAIWDEVM